MSEALGITREEAKALIREAKAERGIPDHIFVTHQLYELPAEEQSAVYEKIQKEREERREIKAAEKKGHRSELEQSVIFIRGNDPDLTPAEAEEILREASERLGVPISSSGIMAFLAFRMKNRHRNAGNGRS